MTDNPFSVETPELMSAEEINELFVPVGESYSLDVSGHVFLHGHRGSGKSMIFRRLSPDCQKLIHNKLVSELSFFGVYLSIKKTDIDLVDYSILKNDSAEAILSEHVLVCFLMSKFFDSIKTHCDLSSKSLSKELKEFVTIRFSDLLMQAGYSEELSIPNEEKQTDYDYISYLVVVMDELFNYHVRYLRRVLSGLGKYVEYSGPLLGYFDFLMPAIEDIKKLSFLPDGPVYFLIDDVDNLNKTQTKIINTWVSYRTTNTISFKLATQLRYKTFSTLSGRRIETPHDYKEIYYSNVYTGSKKERYPQWVKEVTKRRLESFYSQKYGHKESIDPESYFPPDCKQELAIKEIADKYISGNQETRASRKADDAYRYARPDYIISLGGVKKSSSTYKYAGFSQLVHISSGVIRHFLEPASKMYAFQERESNNEIFLEISPSNQNKVIREEADSLLFNQIDDYISQCDDDIIEDKKLKNKLNMLRNLIVSIGSLFYTAMKSNGSERRVFSIAISDPENLNDDLLEVLNLGIQEGFLYETYIGTKEGIGRTRLYVMTRRLAPIFKLDPIGFSAYKFVTCKFLNTCLYRPKTIIGQLSKHGIDVTISDTEQRQESLF